jgi:hypothetical protein
MDLRSKLQIPVGMPVNVINAPRGVNLGLSLATGPADATLLFAENAAVLKADGGPAFQAAKADKLAWVAYPKAGQLGTDLNRDKLWEMLKPMGIRPVRQVSIDETWSALRFRPG